MTSTAQNPLTRNLLNNPELVRYAWLEFTPIRLLLVPGLLLLLLSIFSIGENGLDLKTVYRFSYQGFLWLTIIAGSYQVAYTVVTENANGTWEWQRLSSLSAVRLMFGKLFGACLYKWYIGAWLLLVMLYCAVSGGPDGLNLASYGDKAPQIVTVGNTLILALCLILCAVVSHSLSLFCASLQSDTFAKPGKISAASLCLGPAILGYFAAYFSLHALTQDTGFQMFQATLGLREQSATWYGQAFRLSNFYIASLVFLAYWSITAVLHLFERNLRYHVTVAPFFFFLLSFTFYLSGFGPENIRGDNIMEYAYSSSIGVTVSLLCCYFIAPFEALQVTKYPLWWHDLRSKDWRKLLYTTPLWTVAFGFMVLVCLWATLFNSINVPILRGSFQLPLILFVLRDMLVLHLIVMIANNKRVLSAFWLFMFLAYFALPALFRDIIFNDQKDTVYLAMFFPLPAKDSGMFLTHVIPVALQCSVLGIWLAQKWQSRQQSLAA